MNTRQGILAHREKEVVDGYRNEHDRGHVSDGRGPGDEDQVGDSKDQVSVEDCWDEEGCKTEKCVVGGHFETLVPS